jgi:hypothetical protein
MPVRLPKYRHHKHSGQAYVEINGRFIYLGKFDSQESHEEYKQLIAKYLAQKPTVLDDTPPVPVLEIEELILRYFTFAKTYYIRSREYRIIEETHGKNTLNLVVVTGYLRKLLENVRVVKFLAGNYPELLVEFQKAVEARRLQETSPQ